MPWLQLVGDDELGEDSRGQKEHLVEAVARRSTSAAE